MTDELDIKLELLKERSEIAWEELKKNNPQINTWTNRERAIFMEGAKKGAMIWHKILKDMDNVIKSRVADSVSQQP